MRRSGNIILINHNPHETRVAALQGNRLVEFYTERSKDKGISGNIYKGKVVRVLPGMQAAFVDIGLDRTAFLHATDVYEMFDEFEEFAKETEEERGRPSRRIPIQEILKEGQEIMVQVAKEPIGSKGARITSHISLPGRHIVFTPTDDHIGISRRIGSEKERRRLREIVVRLRPEGSGFIIRTACEGMRADDIGSDMDFLTKLWGEILRKKGRNSAPCLLYEELDLTLRTIRDIFTADIDKLIIDSREEYERAIKFAEDFLPGLRQNIELYESEDPIFDTHGVEIELTDAIEKKVWLKSGGHIVIDQMEALTAIDVNTGRYVGKASSDATILKTNLEAVHEVVHQLRLGNIGGIIVIDFIDMARHPDRRKVYDTLKDVLKIDRARTNILKISELGIVEMTRKRTRESITQSLLEPCPYCDGNGLVKGKDTIVMEIYRDLAKQLPRRRGKTVIYVNPRIAERLKESDSATEDMKRRFGKKIVVKPVETFHQEEYEIV